MIDLSQQGVDLAVPRSDLGGPEQLGQGLVRVSLTHRELRKTVEGVSRCRIQSQSLAVLLRGLLLPTQLQQRVTEMDVDARVVEPSLHRLFEVADRLLQITLAHRERGKVAPARFLGGQLEGPVIAGEGFRVQLVGLEDHPQAPDRCGRARLIQSRLPRLGDLGCNLRLPGPLLDVGQVGGRGAMKNHTEARDQEDPTRPAAATAHDVPPRPSRSRGHASGSGLPPSVSR